MPRQFPSSFFSTQTTEARYYCPEKQTGSGHLRIICAGWEQCRADYKIKRESFPWMAVELVVRGEGWLTIHHHRYRLRAGMLFCYGPKVPYRMETDPAQPLLKYFVDFAGKETSSLMALGALKPGQVRQALYPHELREILDRMVVEGSRRSRLSMDIAANYLRLLLQKLPECAPMKAGQGPSRALEFHLRAKALLDEACERLTSAEAAAQQLGVTPETLCRSFKRFASASPYQYLLRQKMNRAVDLLLGTPLLVKEVGERVGFEDPFHFSRIFKRMQGDSPEGFRRRHRRTG